MSLNTQLADATANAAANAVTALANSGFLDIYDGVQPANANTAITTQNLLVSFPLGNPAFGNAVAGVATANAIANANITHTGTASWFRVFKADHTTVIEDGSVGLATANLVLDSTSLQSGTTCAISLLTYSVLEAIAGE